ncbi:16230_t:CDS:2 [Funneliformis mosseae]|uniref:16230_t:CDS:1 n=1 Tax=Funneliformis mosseae TaxID=27381 RepID=A0A9N9A352_FUNMO|nr:16230_t:CDS:2 [Funneliformis mosseae]
MELEHTIERLLAKKSKFIKLNKTIGKLPVTVESPRGMFFEDMFDICVIELAQLIVDLDPTRIRELWCISSINKKSKHFIVLYDNTMHLCICLTLINHGLVCHHFFAIMLVSSIAKFHIGLLPQRWYTNVLVIEADSTLSNVPAISLLSNNGFAIETGRIEEFYKIYDKLIKEMESKVTQIIQDNEITEFACKKRQVVECNQNKENSIYDNDHRELPHKRLRKALQDNLNTAHLDDVEFVAKKAIMHEFAQIIIELRTKFVAY